MGKTIIVGMAELNVARDGDILITLGLGSCVGVTLYDPITHVGGMVHVMLPESGNFAKDAAVNKAKFADTGVPNLLNRVLASGAQRASLIAKMAGGANMFSSVSNKDVLKIGARNAEAVRLSLRALRIPITADETGGTFGRTISIDTTNGSLLVRTIGHGEKTL